MTRRLVFVTLLFLSLAGALITGREIFYNLFYLWLLLIIAAGLWTWTSLNSVRLARQTRMLRSQVGYPLEERIVVHNDGRAPKLWLEVRDHSDLPGHEASRVVSAVGGREERTWLVRTLCRQRGRFRLGPLQLTSGDPFGLFQVTRLIPQTNKIVVYPAVFDLHDFPLPPGAMPGGDALRRRTHYVTPNASGVRDYAPGDSYNRIHWPSTARRDRLIVKEFELDPLSDIWLIVDGDQSVQAGEAVVGNEPLSDRWWEKRAQVTLPASTEEYAVSAAATLAQYFARRDRAVGLIAHGHKREFLQPDRGERQLTKILETLAVFRATGRLRLHDALTLEADHLPRGATAIVITPSADARWVIGAQGLKRRGLQVVGVCLNAGSFAGRSRPAAALELLWAAGLTGCGVANGDNLSFALSAGAARKN